MMLGKDHDQATLQTLCDAKEYDRIGPSVTNIVRAGAIKRDLRDKEEESTQRAEEEEPSPNLNDQPPPNKPAASKRG
jgi:hypothetical protein